MSRIPSARSVSAFAWMLFALASVAAHADELSELKQLVRQQAEQLEVQQRALQSQSSEVKQLTERVLKMEDERDTAPASVSASGAAYVPSADQAWGSYTPKDGFLLGRSPLGEASLGGYALFRWVDQLPATQHFTDHNGVRRTVDARNDIFAHRLMVFLRGWMFSEKLSYALTVWTVNALQGGGTSIALIGNIGYEFSRGFKLYAGINGLPGTSTLLNNHPYWEGFDRIMSDDWVRPGFTNGVWATGEPIETLHYNVMIANSLSNLGIGAGKLSRDLAYSANVWWMPTTDEFGPRNGFGDFEEHEELATRFGLAVTHSKENRFNDINNPSPDNTQIRLSDSLLLFATDALAPGVTVENANYDLLTVSAGLKYRGFFLQAEYFYRWLSNFEADGPLPMKLIEDQGFYVQSSYMLIPDTFEPYIGTSYIFGEFNDSWDIAGGANWYPFRSRNFRLNAHIIYVDHAAASSVFGYYVGGQTGMTFSLAAGLLF